MKWTADFETTTQLDDCRIWAWAVCEIGNKDHVIMGRNIEEFIYFLSKHTRDDFYFHNLKFDGDFIIHHLLSNGWKHNPSKAELEGGQFSTLISDKGMFYMLEICFKLEGRKKRSVTIYDSLKIIPLSVDKVAKAFGLPISKLTMNYNKERPVGYRWSKEEEEYIKHDVQIMSMALEQMFRTEAYKNDTGFQCTC